VVVRGDGVDARPGDVAAAAGLGSTYFPETMWQIYLVNSPMVFRAGSLPSQPPPPSPPPPSPPAAARAAARQVGKGAAGVSKDVAPAGRGSGVVAVVGGLGASLSRRPTVVAWSRSGALMHGDRVAALRQSGQ
jgi:hypothetical protein